MRKLIIHGALCHLCLIVVDTIASRKTFTDPRNSPEQENIFASLDDLPEVPSYFSPVQSYDHNEDSIEHHLSFEDEQDQPKPSSIVQVNIDPEEVAAGGSEVVAREPERTTYGFDMMNALPMKNDQASRIIRGKYNIKHKEKNVWTKTEHYSQWTQAQDPETIRATLVKLHTILDITKRGVPENARLRAVWGRRFRTRANEAINQDLLSDDVERQTDAINKICLRRDKVSGAFHIGERKKLTERLNKYWNLPPLSAYGRFLDQIKKHPELLEMVRSEDEEEVKQAANLMTPRRYFSRFRRDGTHTYPSATSQKD